MDGLEDDVGQNIAVSDSMPEISTTGIVQATFILITLFIIIVGNILIIISLLTKPSCNKESFSYYILSLAINDLLTGFLIFPFCVYPAIFQKRMYGDMLCRIEGYIGVTLWSITVYTFMWMAVDRYLAVKKPLRYDNIQTITRCKCWVIVSWVTSILLCSPPVLAFSRVRYYHHAFICLPEFSDMLAYSVTLFILILGPSTITIIYSYFYIFKTMYICNRTQSNGQNNLLCGGSMKETLSEQNHMLSFILMVVFWLAWLPWICLGLYEQFAQRIIEMPILQFWVPWIAVSGSIWKLPIYLIMSSKIRADIERMFHKMCCASSTSSNHRHISRV